MPRRRRRPRGESGTPTLSVLQERGFKVALVTDGRMSGASGKVPAAIHVTPEALNGGPLARVRDGDIVVLDADRVGSPERASLVRDLPANGARMVSKAEGILQVFVNGTQLYRDGRHTGDFPGKVLRAA